MKNKIAYIGILLFLAQFSFAQTIYYSKSTGNLNTLATWGTNTNGTGTAPANFTTANCTYIIVNNATPTIGGNWTVSGAGSTVKVGDGAQSINFSVPSPRVVTAIISVQLSSTLTAASGSTLSSTVSVGPNANLILQTAAAGNPVLGTLAAGSTVTYSRAGAQTIIETSYANLSLAGSGNKSLANAANCSVSGTLDIASGVPLILNTNTTFTLSLNGTLTGAGTITGGASSNLTIGGTGAFGTLTPTGATLTLNSLVLNRASLGTITLGGNTTVSTNTSFNDGIIDLNGHTLTLNGTLSLPASAANGTISGSSTSNLSIGATSITNNLCLTSGAQTLNNLTLNSAGQTLTLGNDLVVSGAYTQTAGIVNLNGKTLSLTGTATFATTAANGTISGSATSNLLISATAISNSLFMTTGSETLNNFTQNSPGRTLTLGTTLTVNGAFTHTAGVIALNGQILTLNGAATFPAASANGTITGSGTSDLIINASSITNTLFFTGTSGTLRNLTINSPSQTLKLGTNLTVSGALTQTNGILDLNGTTLTLSGTVSFPASSANGTLTGSSSSNLSISASSVTNNLCLTSGAQTLNNLTLNNASITLTLCSNLTVSGAYVQTRGIVNINGNTLTLSGTATFPTSVARGTMTGSASSNLVVSATTITNSLNMTVGSQLLNNFTLSSPAAIILRLGTALTVGGTFTHTSGILRITGIQFTINGPAIFPTASTNGKITGSNTATLSINSSSVSNSLFFTTGSQTLKSFVVNCPAQTVTMGTPLTVATTFTHTAGTINLNGQTLTLNGTITFPASAANGSFTGSSTSSLSFGAGGASGAYTNSMYMTQGGTANYLNNLTINNTSLPTLTLGNALNIVGTLTPTSGTVACGAGNLTLVATSYSVVARIGTKGANGKITGNVTAQMYAKGGTTGWTTMGSPGLTGRTFADWDDNIEIECQNCPDGFYSNFTSVQWYDETVGGLFGDAARYKVITGTTDGMTIGKGYWVYLGTSTSTTTDLLLDATGPVNQGNYPMALTLTNSGGGTNATDHGYNLICNPYPSPINWTSLRAGNANVGTSIYVYNPDIAGYATYNITGAVSNPAVASGGIGNLIPAGQAFFVQASAATTITALETYKSASTQALLRGGSNHGTTSNSNPTVLRLFADGVSMHNETAMYFHPTATVAYETEYDALYFGVDPGKLGIATSITGYDYSINGLPALNQNLSIPVKVNTGTTGTYQISAHELQNLPSGACVILHDKYTNTDKDLRSGAYSCTISDTEVVARFVLNITINSNLAVSGVANNPSCNSSANGSIIAYATGSAGPWNYYWKDANNNIIKTNLNVAGPDTLKNIAGGVYSVDINTAGSCDNGTQIFVLQGSQSPDASFTPSVYQTALVADTAAISFANNSTNASTYWWDFGDGNGSADTNALNVYSSPGIYTVTLTAYNALCGDSSVTTQVVTIDSAAIATSIAANVTEPVKNMYISKDAGGYFVQFNYKERTGAAISVENVLGEKVMADLAEKNALNQKIYIPLGNSENKILILSVVTDAGDKTFLKVVNQ